MTIKEFARLCGCNPQTLRYYDHVNLLKPVKVDPYSGYRFYEEEQALEFVKIKNLQEAGFTIGEIIPLLKADHDVIYEAFQAKIEELEARLENIRRIRKSYQTEMSQIKQIIEETRTKVEAAMQDYDPEEEFGIPKSDLGRVIGNIHDFFEEIIANEAIPDFLEGIAADQKVPDFDFSEYPGCEGEPEEEEYLDFLNNPLYEPVYEKHGWQHMKDFLEEVPNPVCGEEYALQLEVTKDKDNLTAFTNTALAVVLDKAIGQGQGKKVNMGCNVTLSGDGQNHFWMLRLKG